MILTILVLWFAATIPVGIAVGKMMSRTTSSGVFDPLISAPVSIETSNTTMATQHEKLAS